MSSSFQTARTERWVMIALKRILVATDFGEPSDAALTYGQELARTYNATLHVLHVVGDMYLRIAGDAYLAVLPDLQRDAELTARERLDALLVHNDPTRPVRKVALTSAAPATAIVDYAKANGIDLIVVGTHGRRAVAHLLLGSVAERVLRTAPCPVLTVRHPE